MFSGIVEEVGTVKALEERDNILMWDGCTGKGTVLAVEADLVIKGIYPGSVRDNSESTGLTGCLLVGTEI